MPVLMLMAPVRGWCTSLDEVPDAVFAQRLLGDGVAIDPTGDTLCAPCDGTVTSLPASHHAVVIQAANGAEILLHVGIDTVALAGAGLQPLVAPGALVRTGEPLLRFDLDVLAAAATSLLTPIVVTNGDRFTVSDAWCGRAVEVGDALFELALVAPGATGISTANGMDASEQLVVSLEHGIHARPAALIAGFARSLPADVTVAARGRSANARSPVALMSLGTRRGDELTLSASGAQAAVAVRQLKQRILELADSPPAAVPVGPPSSIATSALPSQGSCLRGVIASRGFALGRASVVGKTEVAIDEAGHGIAHEQAALDRARTDVGKELDRLAQTAGSTAGEIFAAHRELLDDPELTAAARRHISQGKSAAFAWRQAIRDSAETLRALDETYLTERVDDLLDLESRVLMALHGEMPPAAGDLPQGAILIAANLTPSQLVALETDKLGGICTAAGGATSHVAILAAAMGVPALAALGPAVLDIENGTWLVLDAERGELHVAPDPAALAAAEADLVSRRHRERQHREAAHADCRTADGLRIEVRANLGSLAEAQAAVTCGAEGCGLLRSEFLFLDRDQPPDEEEQIHHYQHIARVLGGRPLVVRTLDVGGDKPIPYLPLPPEANPALGLRGVRASLWRQDLLRVQLRAILRVEPPDQCRVLLPMVTDAGEVESVRKLLDELREDIGRPQPVSLGAMIETPAAALMAERIAASADFLSIGTNDLAQYTLAMDRDHAALADRADAMHPAVLRLIAKTVEGAAREGRLVGVCGGLASDPDAVPVLLGLGIRELSVVPVFVPQIKSLVRTLTLDSCRALAERAMSLDTSAQVRELAVARAPNRGG